MSRTRLRVAMDWPGHFPGGAATMAALIKAGADIEALHGAIGGGTPLVDAGAFNPARRANGNELVE